MRDLRRRLPGPQQDRGQAQGHRPAACRRAPRHRARRGTTSSWTFPRSTGPRCATTRSRARSSCSRCSSSPEPAPAVARRPTSSCSPSSSATAWSSPTPPAARPSTAATCPRLRGPRNAAGRGPAWSNSLFEDNAEFGLGMRVGADAQREEARRRLAEMASEVGEELAREILDDEPGTEDEDGIARQRRPGRPAASAPGGHPRRTVDGPRESRGRPGPGLGLDRRWRRLGLRHRLRRARPRAVERAQRQHPGARHRGLLQHRRSGLEGDAPRRHGQVRQQRQDRPARRTSACLPRPTATSTSHRSRWAPTRPRPCARCARRPPTTARA